MLAQQIVNGLTLGCLYALMALGYSMVYGMLQLLNFAHGDVMMIGAFAGWTAIAALPAGLPAWTRLLSALVAASAASVAVGLAVERYAYRPLRGSGRLAPLISVLGASIVIRSGMALITGGRSKAVPTPALLGSGQLAVAGIRVDAVRMLVVGVTVALLLALDFMSRRTSLGRRIRAVAEDQEAAAATGVPVDRVITVTFALGSCLAGVAGILAGLYFTQIDFYMGFGMGLKAFVAAVLGGIGHMRGAALGGLALGLAECLGVALVGPVYKDLIAFVVLIVVLLLRPRGLVAGTSGRSA